MNFIIGFKTLIIGFVASTGLLTTSAGLPTLGLQDTHATVKDAKVSSSSAYLKSNRSFVSEPTLSPKFLSGKANSEASPLPLNGENYIYIKGTYSYLGQSVNYHLLVPRRGGPFSGAINGACNGQLGGDYAGGEGGKISGNAGGSCKFLFAKYAGSTPFKGQLFPKEKLIKIELPTNSIKDSLELHYN